MNCIIMIQELIFKYCVISVSNVIVFLRVMCELLSIGLILVACTIQNVQVTLKLLPYEQSEHRDRMLKKLAVKWLFKWRHELYISTQ